jgi:hypothetical protein
MRRIVLLVGMMSLATTLAMPIASAQGFARSYWLVADNQRHEWCGYTDPTAFEAAAAKLKATESAIVTYTLGKLTDLTQQLGAANGGWIVIDHYTPSGGALQLQRTSMLSVQNLKVVQTASIRGNHAEPLRTLAVTTLQGQPASAPANLSLPTVAVMTDLDSAPYMLLVTQMRHESIPTLCRRVQ